MITNLKKSLVILTFSMILNITVIMTSNFRDLQTTSSVSSCMNASASGTGEACFSASDSQNQCCVLSTSRSNICWFLPKTGRDAETIRNAGYSDISKFKYIINIMGLQMETRCSNDSPFSDAVRNKISACRNTNIPSNENCKQNNDNDVQCCYTKSGDVESCSAFSFDKIKIPSYSMNFSSSNELMSCGLSEEEVMTMQACSAVSPKNTNDCDQKSKGSVSCLYAEASLSSRCVGVKGDLRTAKNLNLVQNLDNVNINFQNGAESFNTKKLITALLFLSVFLLI